MTTQIEIEECEMTPELEAIQNEFLSARFAFKTAAYSYKRAGINPARFEKRSAKYDAARNRLDQILNRIATLSPIESAAVKCGYL